MTENWINISTSPSYLCVQYQIPNKKLVQNWTPQIFHTVFSNQVLPINEQKHWYFIVHSETRRFLFSNDLDMIKWKCVLVIFFYFLFNLSLYYSEDDRNKNLSDKLYDNFYYNDINDLSLFATLLISFTQFVKKSFDLDFSWSWKQC